MPVTRRVSTTMVEVSEEEMLAAIQDRWSVAGRTIIKEDGSEVFIPIKGKGKQKFYELNDGEQFEYRTVLEGTTCQLDPKTNNGRTSGPSVQTCLVGSGIVRTLEDAYEIEQKRPVVA